MTTAQTAQTDLTDRIDPGPEDSRALTAESAALASMRPAQRDWAATPLRERLKVIRALRHALADMGPELAEALAAIRQTSPAATLASEVLPLADGCRWLTCNAAKCLRTRRVPNSGRPLWLRDVCLYQAFQPRGIVLVVGPSNYPLLLTAAPAIQALAAGNAVVLKPAPACEALLTRFAAIAGDCGLPCDLIHVTASTVDAVYETVESGIDLAVFTGSSTHGRQLLAALAETLTPAIVELSGCDAVYVRADADLDLASRAIAYAVALNSGRTCIAARRVFAHETRHPMLLQGLVHALAETPPVTLDAATKALAEALIADATAKGARIATGGFAADGSFRPCVLDNLPPEADLARTDVFAPIVGNRAVAGDDEALAAGADGPYHLGASIFSRDEAAARAFALRLRAPTVTVNDVIAPTADPRLAFGGAGESGYGKTRGAEGLRAMTVSRYVSHRRGKHRPHLDDAQAGNATVLGGLLRLLHAGTLSARLRALKDIATAMRPPAAKK